MTNYDDPQSLWQGFSRIWNTGTILGLLGLAGLYLAGYGPGRPGCTAPVGVAAPVTIPQVVAPAPAPAVIPEAVVETIPAARVYFDLNSSVLPATVEQVLTDVIAHLKTHEGTFAVVSGYHDPSGDFAHNQQLAKTRAEAVRDYLVAAGIALERIDMQKPVETTGTGAPEEARRVEVTIR